jgi:hypothetical protein
MQIVVYFHTIVKCIFLFNLVGQLLFRILPFLCDLHCLGSQSPLMNITEYLCMVEEVCGDYEYCV